MREQRQGEWDLSVYFYPVWEKAIPRVAFRSRCTQYFLVERVALCR